ncbi:hypothetical protein K7X08_030551 [Anisodus acutangulus]|uniref:Transmembrane 9 superfamily member n=1 Tax=Anisodus acutangulus TaxID=402998 RepID=A0A9Q1RP30_9SOLA|nr:hypothetical protein K7X08_030551 [Anisodus acutangulus]
MPPNAEHVTVLRVMIREDFSRTLAERLVNDIQKVLHELDTLPTRVSAKLSATEESEGGVHKKSAMEVQLEITNVWKKFVAEKKKIKNVPEVQSLLAAALGSGTQLFTLTIFIFVLALVSVFYPYNRGALFTTLVVIYALTSGIAGYTASSFYCQLEGTSWVCFHDS